MRLIEKDPCVDKEALFWETYKEIVRRGAEMYSGGLSTVEIPVWLSFRPG